MEMVRTCAPGLQIKQDIFRHAFYFDCLPDKSIPALVLGSIILIKHYLTLIRKSEEC